VTKLVNLKIELGNCTCPFSFPHPIAKTCRRDNAIVLGPKCTERYILAAINHETIHAVLDNLFGTTLQITMTDQVSRQFDNLFPSDEDSVSEDGTPK